MVCHSYMNGMATSNVRNQTGKRSSERSILSP
jgi:hypothetical protein